MEAWNLNPQTTREVSHHKATQTRRLGRQLDHSLPVGLTRPSSWKNIFIIFTLLSTPKHQGDSYKSVPKLLGLICLDLSWGSLITYPNTRPARSMADPTFYVPQTPQAPHKATFAPLGMPATSQAWKPPRGTFQGHPSPVFPLAKLVVFPLLWTHGTSYKFPGKSSQITFEHLLCNRYTALRAGKDKNN